MNEWQEWKKRQEDKLRQKIAPAPKAKTPKEPLVKRPITDHERWQLKNLQRVRTAWWCGDGRFLQQFEHTTEATEITERQAWFIKVLWYKYRKQLGHDGPKPEGYR